MGRDVGSVIGERGWATGPELLRAVSRSTLQRWVAAGSLVRLAPGIFALPSSAADWRVRVAAALHDREAVASHATALALWGLIPHPPGPVHITVARTSSSRAPAGVVAHRPTGTLVSMRAAGLPASPPARAVVDAWGDPVPARAEVRAAAITAVRRRLCTPRDLSRELARSSRVHGRAELLDLVGLLAAGCRSELEIWGCLHVLRGPGMPVFVQQRPLTVGGSSFLLDAACEESMLAIEMDGAAWHGSPTQRESDLRRDALVATTGWQTLRFSYRRMTGEPTACRREIRAVHDARLRLLVDRVR